MGTLGIHRQHHPPEVSQSSTEAHIRDPAPCERGERGVRRNPSENEMDLRRLRLCGSLAPDPA